MAELRITDRYLDTASVAGRLATAGYRARLRRRGTTVELTLKQPGRSDGGLSERIELTGPASASRHPGRWPASVARDRLVAIVGSNRLVEIAALRQRRLVRRYRRDQTEIEVSLDALEAIAEGRTAARSLAVELELLAGDRAALTELAAAVRSMPGVHDADGSKLDFARSVRQPS